MVHLPWPENSWVESTEVQNREYQWLHKMATLSPHTHTHTNKTKKDLRPIPSLSRSQANAASAKTITASKGKAILVDLLCGVQIRDGDV